MASTMTASISGLIHSLKSGDPSARDAIVIAMQDRLLRLTASILRDFPSIRRRRETESVLNDLNEKILGAIDGGFLPENSNQFIGFAAQKLRWLLIDEARKLGVRGTQAQLALNTESNSTPHVPEPGTDTYNPVVLAEWSEFFEQIEKLLTDDERQVFNMHFFLNMKQCDIAEELGLEEKPVSRTWLKAIMKLRPYLPKLNPGTN